MSKVKLKDVCSYVNNKIDISKITPDRYISTENMLQDRHGITESDRLPPIPKGNHFVEDDILISNIRPYFKKIWFANFNGASSSDVLIIRSDVSKVFPKYLYYVLYRDSFFSYVMVGKKGLKMPRGDKNFIMNYSFDLPTLDKQKQLIELLEPVEKQIELNKNIIDDLSQYLQLIYHSWFVDFNYSKQGKLTFNTVNNESKQKPKNWSYESLGNGSLSIIIPSGIEVFNNHKNYIATADIQRNMLISHGEKIEYPNKPSRANMQPTKHSVWFARMRDSQKSFSLCNDNDVINNYIFSTGMAGLQCTETSYYYITTFINSPKFLNKKNRMSIGSTQKSINNSGIKSVKILNPGSEVLSRFNLIVKPIYDQIEYLNINNRTLRRQLFLMIEKYIS